jgi:hypothetical protein
MISNGKVGNRGRNAPQYDAMEFIDENGGGPLT